MRRIFLGKWFHWLLLVLVIGLGAAVGDQKLHVTDFNAFLSLLTIAATVMVILVIWTTRPGEQVTRDPLISGDDDQSEPSA